MSEDRKGDKSPDYDRNIDQVVLAIAAHVRGESMAQAGREQGFGRGWLTNWKCGHPKRFQALYAEAVDKFAVICDQARQSGAERDQLTTPLTREGEMADLLPRLGPVERQIMVLYWGLKNHSALEVAEINQQLFQGSPIWEAKVRGTIKAAEEALRSMP